MSQTDAGAAGQTDAGPVDGKPAGPYRSLFDRLRTLAEHLPVSHVVSDTAHGRFLGALTHYLEFGEEILDAADSVVVHIADQLHNVAPAQRKLSTHVAEVIAAPYPSADADDADVTAQLAFLQQQLAALQAERVNQTSTAVSEPVPAGGQIADVQQAPPDPSVGRDPATPVPAPAPQPGLVPPDYAPLQRGAPSAVNPAGIGGADVTAALQGEQANQPAPQAYPPLQSAPDQPPAPPSPPAPDQTGGNA